MPPQEDQLPPPSLMAARSLVLTQIGIDGPGFRHSPLKPLKLFVSVVKGTPDSVTVGVQAAFALLLFSV